jgi:uncharacterized membrane protein YkoI
MSSRHALVVLVASLWGACSNEREEKLRAALAQADVRLGESVGIAEANVAESQAVRAALLVDADPVYSVGAHARGDLSDVRVDISTGEVLSVRRLGGSGRGPCPGPVGLEEAIAIAEERVGGQAVSIQPDDGECNREVEVLTDDALWEVEVGYDGRVTEVEHSDDD